MVHSLVFQFSILSQENQGFDLSFVFSIGYNILTFYVCLNVLLSSTFMLF